MGIDEWEQERFQSLLYFRRGKLYGDTEPRNFLQTKSLLQFCMTEFLQLLENGVKFRRCPRCGKLLAGGKVGKPQIYCSEACLKAIFRRKQKEEASRLGDLVAMEATKATRTTHHSVKSKKLYAVRDKKGR